MCILTFVFSFLSPRSVSTLMFWCTCQYACIQSCQQQFCKIWIHVEIYVCIDFVRMYSRGNVRVYWFCENVFTWKSTCSILWVCIQVEITLVYVFVSFYISLGFVDVHLCMHNFACTNVNIFALVQNHVCLRMNDDFVGIFLSCIRVSMYTHIQPCAFLQFFLRWLCQYIHIYGEFYTHSYTRI